MRQFHYKINISKFIRSIFLVSVFSLCLFRVANAANLYISPASSKVSVGNIVSVKVLVGTNGKYINNVDGTVQFPVDLLEVLSISKSSSIFSLWVEDPRFSNFDGKITFNGGIPTPGYFGENGEIISITFKSKKSGTASIVFSDSAVRENDGLGTDILTSKQSGLIVIDSGSQLEVPPVNTSSNNVPAKPIITSLTHPQQDSWYSSNSASFSWTIPNDITSVQTLLGKSPNSTPTVIYDSSVSQRTVNNLTDGILYFHLRYQNSIGWGPVAHYKIQVDSTSPEKFSVYVTDQGIDKVVLLNAVDTLSGIDSYSLQIDGGVATRIKKETLIDNEYVLPTQNKGEHELVVVAYDKAGNHTESKTSFSSSSIIPPILSIYPDYVTKGETAEVRGITKYSGANAVVFVQAEHGDKRVYTGLTANDGSFVVSTDEFEASDIITVWSQLVFSDSIKSPLSDKISFKVNDTPLVKTTKSVTYTLAAIIPLFILILLLIYISYMGWHKFFGLKKRVIREVNTTVDDVHKALSLFKEELGKQLDVLEKTKQDRDLNKKEEKIFKELQNNIDSIDELILKKIKKIK